MPPTSSPVTSGTAVCDLVIPVFNHPDLLRDLLASLAAHTNRALLGRIWIGDDASDAFTADACRRFAETSGLPVTVIRHEQTLGFGGNCNALFTHVQSRYCIVLNTDLQVPPFWLERMLAPFQADPAIALATPFSTNAANHTIRLKAGQSWMEVDRLLASRAPEYPDDCTAISFCMAMDVTALRTAGLFSFDPAYGRGYGEDTDLHYRVLAAGLRSVIVDNLFIHHVGGSSFSSLGDAADIRDEGRSAFLRKWGDVHVKAHEAFVQRGALDRVIDPSTREFRFKAPAHHIDVLFVLPSTHLRYGGVWFASRIIQDLTAAGFSAAAYVKDEANLIADTTSFGFRVFQNLADLRASVSSLGCTVSTSDVTVRPALSLSQEYKSKEVLFLQCMEVAFRSGISIDTFMQYRRIPNVVTVSEALQDYIRIIRPGVNVTALPIGPDPDVFYPRETERIPKTIAIAMNSIPEKAYTHSLELGLMLRDRGFSLTFFGWDQAKYPVAPNIGTVFTDTSRDALAGLFSRTEFLIDESYLEGLGLIPLEAAFCGCVPILSSKGAPEYLFQDGRDSIRIHGYRGLKERIDSIVSLSPEAIAGLRHNAIALRSTCNLPAGLGAAREAFGVLSGRKEPAAYSGLAAYAVTPA